MKNKVQTLVFTAMLATGAMLAPALHAEAEPTVPPDYPAGPGNGGKPGDQLKKLKEQLGLSDAQVEQLKPIHAARRDELRALGKPSVENAEQRKAIREKYKPQIAAILTAEQNEMLAKIEERRQGGGEGKKGEGKKGEGKKGKKGDGDGAGAPPPPPEM